MSSNNGKNRKKHSFLWFIAVWIGFSLLFPKVKIWSLVVVLAAIVLAILAVIAFFIGKNAGKKKSKAEEVVETYVETDTKKAGDDDAAYIIREGNKALSEMGRLYASITNPEVRSKINEIMRITDKITQDAVQDPRDIPQIKKFMNYYLPTTIKLLNSYDRMSSLEIEGDNLDKSMNSIEEMLDVAIAAYKKRLDSLFEDQALDIETDIEVMNTMLAREGLSGGNDFNIKTQ